jgi:hypothetical protein
VNGKYRFYSINLTTGQAFSLGRFDNTVVDIAIPLEPEVTLGALAIEAGALSSEPDGFRTCGPWYIQLDG